MKNISAWAAIAGLTFCSTAFAAGPQTKATPAPVASEELWKGPIPDQEIQLSALVGASISGTHGDLAMAFDVAKRVVEHGFIPDISDDVFLELGLGPDLLASPGTGILYSVHARWNFHMNEIWSLYAIAGVGGSVITTNGSNTASMHPRLSAGAFYHVAPALALRMEIGADFLGGGISVGF
ncbi:MAG TPA: hypothetical protein VL588_12465 [Bdellovibrionota bacterium]|jgi:hypothetical protein|nr:hypothetical protein [Bdellovibrionota bacterium]